MTPDIIIVSAILLGAVVLLVTEKLPVDVTGIGIITCLMLSGVLSPSEAVSGFSNPAPLAVGALFVVSSGLVRTGALNIVTKLLIRYTGGSRFRLMLLSLLLVGVLSAFLNNTPVVVLSMPIVMAVCAQHGFTPSKFLIPLSYISILAGTCTLIGTSTNILVSDVAASLGSEPIAMFELSTLGVPLALLGGAFMLFFSDFIMPTHSSAATDETEQGRYLSELNVPEGSKLIGVNPVGGKIPGVEDVKIYEVYRSGRIFDLSLSRVMLKEDDFLLLRGTVDGIARLLENGDVVLPSCSNQECFESPHVGESKLVELLIPTGSGARGVAPQDLPMNDFPDVSIIGFIRHHEHYSWRVAQTQRLRIGDILLVQASPPALENIRKNDDFIILNDDVVKDVINWKRAPIAVGFFAMMVLAVATGKSDILTASFAAAFGMILTNCLTIREAYHAVNIKVLLLTISTISLGFAMQKSGADALYADLFLGLFRGGDPHTVLAAFIVLTSLLSHFLSNNSTAVLLVPVAMATATSLGVDPRPFIIGVAFGASACYATPIGYQTNLIVYGPGGYQFSDYLRLGLPMAAIVCGGSALMIPLLWPF